MEQKLNIAKILKNKPRGTKLYSMIHGKCSFEAVTDEIFKINFCTSKFGLTQSGECTLIKFGNMYDGGECIIFPSKEMRDWSKFSWKKGDVLISNDGSTEVIFDKWYDNTYTSFYCKHYLNSEDETKFVYYEEFICTTERYAIEDKDKAQIYIGIIEERLGGKLNRETLEVEKAQPEFKDGDIVALVVRKCTHIAIFQSRQEAYIGFYAVLCQNDELLLEEPFREDVGDIELRIATEEEKQKLFDALAKEGKRWDSDKKAIVDLKPKCEFKTFDKVVVRCSEADRWSIDFFSYKVHNGYICTGDAWFGYCLPYNEETAKLVGTTNDWEGGKQ